MVYPDPKDFTTRHPELHTFWRIVVQYTGEQNARRTAARIRDELGIPCVVQGLVGMFDRETGDVRGEIVMHSEFLAAAFVPAPDPTLMSAT